MKQNDIDEFHKMVPLYIGVSPESGY
jgi:hypothetical protein